MSNSNLSRRAVIGGVLATGAAMTSMTWATPLHAQGLGLSSILGKASDSALDKLARPGAFYGDEDVRIGLPFIGRSSGLLGSLFGGASRLGLLDGFIRTLNSAAGTAAGEAKPIFRTAIDDLSFSDVPGIARNNDGGTRYLRQSSNDALHGKLDPLVDSALGDLGAHSQLESLNRKYSWLAAAGLDRRGLTNTVTDQGLDGIFTYLGREEAAFRKNPLRNVGGILGEIF